MISRRSFVSVASAAALSACTRLPGQTFPEEMAQPKPIWPPLPEHYGAVLDEPYPVPDVPDVPDVPEGIVAPHLWRQEVVNPFPADAQGTIIVDPDAAFLHLIGHDGQAMRYGVGVGAAGYTWSGEARMQFRRKWPRWKAPDTMIARRPEFEPFSVANGVMGPGPGNPLGAWALYLFQNCRDTLQRIHGACEPQ